MLLLRSIFFALLLPGTVTIWVPYWIVSTRASDAFMFAPMIRYAGAPLIIAGAVGLLWCIWDFFSRGRGTLAPIDPPKYLVVRGLYRYVRNPMYCCVVTILFGETLFFQSKSIFFEAVIFFAAAYLFVALYEEPALRRQFGESYAKYLQAVPGWFPKWKHRS